MNYLLQKTDYKIEIGAGECEVINLTVNLITCIPPKQQPEIENNFVSYNGERIPNVKVCLKIGLRFLSYHVEW